MAEELQDEIRGWAMQQDDRPALATAIRRLVDLGLSHSHKAEKLEPRIVKKASKTMDALARDLRKAAR